MNTHNKWMYIIALIAVFWSNCNANKNQNIRGMEDSLQSFEIIMSQLPNLYCKYVTYTINNKKLIVTAATLDGEETNEQGLQRQKCVERAVFERSLSASDDLNKISRITTNQLEAIPNEVCEGGISYRITLKKAGKTKEIFYGGCAKSYDDYTKMIVQYINSQVPRL